MMAKQVGGAFLGTLAAGVVLVGVTKVIGPIPLSISQTTTNKQSTFDVTGEGETTAVPDRAQVSAGIQINETSVSAAQEKGNKVIDAITKDVIALGVDKADIKTSNYNLYPNYNYQTGNQQITGYSLNANLQITIKDFSKISQVIDKATADGANQVGGVNFTFSDAKQEELENTVRQIAIGKAKQKAESLSKIAGFKLGKIVNVTEGNNIIPRPVPYLMNAQDISLGKGAGGAPSTATPVEPGSSNFSMTVTLSYETL
ncbi:MAG TPA: SIMPL domain-containing protein [Patescibacteria group bacterium]|nr:SIMPL domain-containing protein [Patescibacteria group bacterium]